ncbi:hypothetical protein [Actinoplanes couchii]|uniref:Uncharacterized protein n=1 Tax=Actinoplanes couchii TaxID=403638 RepID=A0ABQ3XKY1_9ACTN|nr:hypothetical protein [Actinoplanes couchii]MDR6319464.1 hypothetical protein [Actinoplanes couchii]GID59146.1 hypothetical protein Aco03nite_075500 [Actinoplanes couchii]
MFEFEDESPEPQPSSSGKDRAVSVARSFLLMIGLAVVALAAAGFLVIWAVDVLGTQSRS